MKVKILSIHNQGDFDNEYVLLEVLAECDIGIYLLMDSTYTADNKISNKVRHPYWFPDKQVKKGDFVSLWTKAGKSTTGDIDGRPVHRFFWGLKEAVWNNDGDCAVLMELNDWQHHKAGK